MPEPPKEKPREEMKVEQPPDETPALVPIPDVKPPEKVENSPPPAPVTAQQVKGGAPRIEPSWQTSLVRQLQRFKRYPARSQSRNEQGVVLLSFSLDRAGHVLAHSIATQLRLRRPRQRGDGHDHARRAAAAVPGEHAAAAARSHRADPLFAALNALVVVTDRTIEGGT